MRKYLAPIIALALLITAGCKDKKPTAAKLQVIQPLVAGQFYLEDPGMLKSMIDNFFQQTPEIKFPSNLLGFMIPHAGYIYSGPVAAYAFKNIPLNRYKRIVIIFPSHWQQFRGVLAIDGDAYHTPLGDVAIDRQSVQKLIAADPSIFWKPDMYIKEHSGEVMLPFLQERLGDSFKIIPLMMGDQSPNMARRLADILERTFGAETDILYIASSDMSHYHDYETANAMDAITLSQIINLDPDALVGDLGAGRAEICGYGGVLTLMRLSKLKGGQNARVLEHKNSGDTQGDKSRVVGYGTVEFFTK